uniref:Uncharacterized protein n=1 Tax=Sphaerodactylus townsendi TaxID=933632 RepID=A0ACB8EYQ5_9SAUR
MKSMVGRCHHLLGMVVLTLIVQGIVVTGNSDQGVSIQVKHKRNGIYLFCRTGKDSKVLNWTKDGKDIGSANEKELLVGSAVDDPRGLYQCNSEKANGSLQLYFRMCQYCVQLNSAVVIGMVAAEVVATALLVAAVWCLAAQEPGRRSQALLTSKAASLQPYHQALPCGEQGGLLLWAAAACAFLPTRAHGGPPPQR